MADKKVILEVEIIEGNAQSTLNELNASLKSLDKTHKDYKPTLQLIAQAERDLAKAQQNRILVEKGLANSAVKVEKETKKTAKQMKQLSSDTGASTSATLELGRVFSDMPYGIRGVANNIQQLASNLFFMSKKTDEATGKTVGFRGAVGSLLKNLAGPAGILVAFQAGIALLDFFKVGMGKAEKETEKGTKAINAQVTSLQKLLNLKKSIENLLFSETDSIVLSKYSEGLLSLDETVKIISRNYGDFSNAYNKLTDEQKKDKENVKALLEGYKEMLSLKEKEKKQINKIQLLKVDVDKQERAAAIRKKQGYKDGLITISQERKQLTLLEGDYIKTQKRLIKLEEYFSKERGKKVKPRAKVDSLYREIRGMEDLISDEDLAKIEGELIIKAKVDPVLPERDKIAEFIEHYKTLMSGLTDFIDGEFERELTIEQNKTNAINAELNNRLLNENLSKDQRASIQNEIAQNDEKLRIKQEAIKRKAFNTQKAFNIASALIETYAAASSAFRNTLANPINKLLPDAGLLRAKIAAGVATAGGLAQVAAIARQKYQSSSAATPVNMGGGGSSGGGTARAEPSFNIVGRSEDSLLINAIQSQFDKPLKAYVVARDVTNQQQLDGVISTSAST